MPTYISPEGNPEVWDEQPEGYVTWEEWIEAHPAPEPTPEELAEQRRAAFSAAIESRLNDFAAEKQYDNISSARLAAFSAEFNADGVAAQSAYDALWTEAIPLFPDVVAGEKTVYEAMAELPFPDWPQQE